MSSTETEAYIASQKNWITRLLARRQVEAIEIEPEKDVIDIGCGRGIMEMIFGNRCRRFESCDIEDQNMYDLNVTICPAEDLLFPDNLFDIALMIGVMEHVPDPGGAVRECRRVLKPGGKLIASIPNGWLWKIIRFLPVSESALLHTRFNAKSLFRPMTGWKCTKKKMIIPGLFWLYEFTPINEKVS